jgi:hypothetical protein
MPLRPSRPRRKSAQGNFICFLVLRVDGLGEKRIVPPGFNPFGLEADAVFSIPFKNRRTDRILGVMLPILYGANGIALEPATGRIYILK